jgi:hypothetical protein
VRRDLLMMVRRAILRVAFLAELVLAMSQISFGGDRSLNGRASARRPSKCVIDDFVFSGVPDNAILCKQMRLHDGAAQRTAAAGLRPPPLRPL